MSADRQRLVGAIRRMVKSDPDIRDLLDAFANRGDQAGSGAKAASQGEEERICCDGSTAPANLGTEERDPDASAQTGLDPDDPARLTAGDGTLSGVTDCATGDPICMDGSGHIPPDGWDAPNEPPVDPDYVEGVYYQYSWTNTTAGTSGSGTVQTCTAAKEAVIAGTDPCIFEGRTVCPDGISITIFCNGLSLSSVVSKRLCSSDPNPICDEDPPLATAWPEDGCVNLAVISGTLVGSKYDPENGGSYSVPTTSRELCDGATSILYQPLAGGGFRTIESSAGAALTGAVGYTYSSDGSITGTITQAEWDATAP